MEARITSITLGVSDINRAIRFYRDGLGFPTQVVEGASFAFFTTEGTRLALFPLNQLTDYVGSKTPRTDGAFPGIALVHHIRRKEEVSEVLALAE